MAKKPGYDLEFFSMMLLRMAKKNCRHCHESGAAGRRPGTEIPVPCQCVVQNVVKYNRLKKPKPIRLLKAFRRAK